MSADTSGGSIRIGRSEGSIDADTSGGSITVKAAHSAVSASTSGGSIKVGFAAQPDGRSRLDTSGGMVTVYLADGIAMDIRARSGVGVTSAFTLENAQMKPGSDPAKAGRDHGPAGFSIWMAGAGIRGGTVFGATDDIGYRAVENRVSVADWHATVLHALGMEYEELFFEKHGLKERLTGVQEARVVSEIFA